MIPHISDKGRRALRTFLQVLGAFLSFAVVYPAIVHAIGAPTGSRVELWLATAGSWITIAATVITRLMAIPAVDQVLTLLGVGSIPRGQVQVSLKQLEAAGGAAGADALEQDEVAATAPAIEKLEDIEAALADPAPTPAAPAALPAAPVVHGIPVDPTVSTA